VPPSYIDFDILKHITGIFNLSKWV